MKSRLVYSIVNLLSLIFVLNTFCFVRASSQIDYAKNNPKSERLVKSSFTVNKVCNKTKEMIRFADKSIRISNISLLNASVEILDANVQILSQHTGYIPIKRSHGARLFYFFIKSRGSESDPVVLWLSGGPGYGSATALFYENGPFRINDDLTLKWNEFGWDKVCNIIYVDQPTGAGFSYSSDQRDIRQNSKEVSKDLYDFVQAFFEAHPKYLKNDFYIAGASYSGRTVPLLASRIHKKNKYKEGIHINLKGLAINNGDINVKYRYSSYADFVYANKLVSKSSYHLLKKLDKECLTLIQHCQNDNNICKEAANECGNFFTRIKNMLGDLWPYDIRKRGLKLSNFPIMTNFFALDHVKKTLGVDNRTYVVFSQQVFDAMRNDQPKIYAGVIPQLLEDGIKVLIFDGQYDFICNWLGNLRSLEAMKWSGQNQFLKTKLTSYKVDGKKVGEVKNIGPLTFIKVYDAGHTVSKSQPYVSLQMIKQWMNS